MYFVEGLLNTKETKNCFALEIKGNGLCFSGIQDGDKVVVRRQDDVNNGDIAAVLVKDKAYCARIIKEENAIKLKDFHGTQVFEGDEMQKVKILGKVICTIRSFEQTA